MLPLLRILPVGGVFLAITIVLLALNPPGGTDSAMPSAAPARGALVRAGDHPEWRQFLIQAAVRRASELERLRDLPDTPTIVPEVKVELPPPTIVPEPQPETAEPPAKITSLPSERTGADPDDVTGSIVEQSGATLPMEIGETSSTELPVVPLPENPPVIRTPERAKPQNDSGIKPAKRRARAKPAPPVEQPTQSLFEQLFGPANRPQATPPAPRQTPSRPATASNAPQR